MSHTLSQFDFQLNFRGGKSSARPDALSRREQDMPKNTNDDRLKSREFQLIKDVWIKKPIAKPLEISHMDSAIMCSMLVNQHRIDVNIPSSNEIFQDENLQELWNQGCSEDWNFSLLYKALKNNQRIFPTNLSTKISISECDFDERGALRFRKRVWVPNWEPLQTALIQKTRDSYITGHPGRDSTYANLSRNFFWPGASSMVRVFCKNCDVCGHSHVWREKKKGLLLPLPIPDRFHSELSIDFMTDLPAKSKGDPKYLMVITDRLLESCTLEPMKSMTAEDCTDRFITSHYRFHGFPYF